MIKMCPSSTGLTCTCVLVQVSTFTQSLRSGRRLRGYCDDPYVDGVTKGETGWVEGLPCGFEFAVAEGCSECNLEGGLCARFRGVEREFFRCAEDGSTHMSEAIVRVPVAGSAILDEPLFVDGRAVGDGCVIGNGEVFDIGQVVDAVGGIGGCGGNNNGR